MGPSTYSQAILRGLQFRRPGEVYQGTAKGRHRPAGPAPATRRRARHRDLVARRSATVRAGR